MKTDNNSTIDLGTHTEGEWEVKESESKPAFNVVGTALGGKYKIARCPYIFDGRLSSDYNNKQKEEAKANAAIIVKAVNNHLLLLRKLESLVYVLEMERKQNGISLSDDYKTLYKEAKQLLEQLK